MFQEVCISPLCQIVQVQLTPVSQICITRKRDFRMYTTGSRPCLFAECNDFETELARVSFLIVCSSLKGIYYKGRLVSVSMSIYYWDDFSLIFIMRIWQSLVVMAPYCFGYNGANSMFSYFLKEEILCCSKFKQLRVRF